MIYRCSGFLLFASVAITLSACQSDTGSRLQVESDHAPTRQNSIESSQYVKGNVLVGLKPESDYREVITQLEKQYEGMRLQRMLMENDSAVIALFGVPKGQEKSLITAFEKHSAVEYAEVDGIMTIQ